MGYTSVKGGADAIAAAERLIQYIEMDDDELRLEVRQIRNQLRAAVDQVMGEGGLYSPDLAALALKQAEGDMAEASFMVRAYRSTLPRIGTSLPVEGAEMSVERRISSTFRDVPGGQLLGRTRDYTQRLLNIENPDGEPVLAHEPQEADADALADWDPTPQKVSTTMRAMKMIPALDAEADAPEPDDITRDSMRFPVSRSAWLQSLARSETGALVALAYSSLRGYGASDHGTIAELRVGNLPVRYTHPVTGEPVTIGHVRTTECQMTGSQKRKKKKGEQASNESNYGLSYGMVFGQNERKAISMSILDSTLMAAAKMQSGSNPAPANDQEMVLYSSDGIESFGFVEHLKLPPSLKQAVKDALLSTPQNAEFIAESGRWFVDPTITDPDFAGLDHLDAMYDPVAKALDLDLKSLD